MRSAARPLLVAGLISLCVSSAPLSQLIQAYRQDDYWTHAKHPLPLDQTTGRFQVLINNEDNNEDLGRLVETGQIQVVKLGQASTVRPEQVLARVNRLYEKTRLPLVLCTVFATLGVAFIALGLAARCAKPPAKRLVRRHSNGALADDTDTDIIR